MTQAQKAEIRHEALVSIVDDARLALRVIDPDQEADRIDRLLAEADDRTREMMEQYGGLHPVTFGHCGYPGLCVRGTARGFCIGCEYLVRRPEYLDRVDLFIKSYAKAAEEFQRMGDLAGTRERRRVITQLRELRQEMLLLADAERHATRVPTWAQLPAASES
jgi:hypothetical protein